MEEVCVELEVEDEPAVGVLVSPRAINTSVVFDIKVSDAPSITDSPTHLPVKTYATRAATEAYSELPLTIIPNYPEGLGASLSGLR